MFSIFKLNITYIGIFILIWQPQQIWYDLKTDAIFSRFYSNFARSVQVPYRFRHSIKVKLERLQEAYKFHKQISEIIPVHVNVPGELEPPQKQSSVELLKNPKVLRFEFQSLEISLNKIQNHHTVIKRSFFDASICFLVQTRTVKKPRIKAALF